MQNQIIVKTKSPLKNCTQLLWCILNGLHDEIKKNESAHKSEFIKINP